MTPLMTDINEYLWCRDHYDLLSPGGTWIVPRSGLVFQKSMSSEERKLILIEKINTNSSKRFKQYQNEDFLLIKEKFGLAGIEVVRE